MTLEFDTTAKGADRAEQVSSNTSSSAGDLSSSIWNDMRNSGRENPTALDGTTPIALKDIPNDKPQQPLLGAERAAESFLPEVSFEDSSLPAKPAVPETEGGQNIPDTKRKPITSDDFQSYQSVYVGQ
ncbi:MAG: hypothetical protein IAF58_21660 [Leptolyngbya sp.]|nr:hypothetical protein [Candidatus Melainabacteria bacterium]